jgi:hypothetical protein
MPVLHTEVFDLSVPCDFGRVQAHDPDHMDRAASVDLVCADMLVNENSAPKKGRGVSNMRSISGRRRVHEPPKHGPSDVVRNAQWHWQFLDAARSRRA